MTTCRKILFRISFWLALWLLLPACWAVEIKSRSVRYEGREQAYLYFSPNTGNSDKLPAVTLLHGAGDRAANMVDAWKGFASKQKIILLAPELPREEKYEEAAPQTFRCVVEDAKPFVRLDSRAFTSSAIQWEAISPTTARCFSRSTSPRSRFMACVSRTITHGS